MLGDRIPTSEEYIAASTKKWVEFAARPDIVGKKIEYHSGRNIQARGEISRIEVKDGRVEIYCKDKTSPFKQFTIDEENAPCGTGKTTFVDLDDDDRQLQIHM